MSILDDFTYLNRFVPKYPDDTDYNTNSPSFYEYLARQNKLMEYLTKKITNLLKDTELSIEDFNNRLDKIKEEMKIFFKEWLKDGTIDHIINTVIFSNLNEKINVIQKDASEYGVKYDGSDEREAMQIAINESIKNKTPLYISKPVRVEPITHVDGSKICLYAKIDGDHAHLYEEGFSLAFKEGAYLYTETKVEATLLRWKCSNSRIINGSFKGVRSLTTLLEFSRYNKKDLSESNYICFNKIDDCKFKHFKTGMSLEGQTFYNEFNHLSFMFGDLMIGLFKEYALKNGLVARSSNVNRNNFTNITGNVSLVNGINIDYGDTNKFINLSLEGLTGTGIILNDYSNDGLYYTEDNTFTNVTFEKCHKQIYDNSNSTNYYNVDYEMDKIEFIKKKPRFLLGGVNSAFTPSILHSFITNTEDTIYKNELKWSSSVLSANGLFAMDFSDFKKDENGDVVENYNRSSIHFTELESINIDSILFNGDTAYNRGIFKRMGGIVFYKTRFSFIATDKNKSIVIPYPKKLKPTEDILFFGNLKPHREPIILNDKTHYCFYSKDGIEIPPPPVDGWKSVGRDVVYLSLNYFAEL